MLAKQRKSFTDFKFNKQLLDAIAEAGYTHLTPVQEKVLGPALSGQDLIAVAPTGTGKTATYALPLLRKLNFPQGDEPRALVLTPTRELAMQIGDHITMLGKHTGLRTVVIYGGLGPKRQIEAVSAGLDILVATPGRFMDIYLAGHLPLKRLQFMVIDEADKMMDMGFRPAINRILEVVPRKRQNLLFSATFPPKVEALAADFLKFPMKIEVEPQATPAPEVRQCLYEVPNFKTKLALLMHLLEGAIPPEEASASEDAVLTEKAVPPEENRSPEETNAGQEGTPTGSETSRQTIIFCKTKQAATNIGRYLLRKKGAEKVRILHGNKGQNTRINAINDFREGRVSLLVATDVVSRGIDISGVSLVINFDIPLVYEDYVHRIGRTGRARRPGDAITFCTPPERYHLLKIQELIRQKIPVKQLPAEVKVSPTPYQEQQAMLREIDHQRRKDDPGFQGAFHDKKTKKHRNKK